MTMTPVQTLIMVLALAAGSAVMRFLPRFCFLREKHIQSLLTSLLR